MSEYAIYSRGHKNACGRYIVYDNEGQYGAFDDQVEAFKFALRSADDWVLPTIIDSQTGETWLVENTTWRGPNGLEDQFRNKVYE